MEGAPPPDPMHRADAAEVMVPVLPPAARAMGFWSAAGATVLSLTYVAGQLAEWLGWLGSAGGPKSASTPLGLAVLLTPSLLLGPAFLLMVVSIHELASPARRVWSRAAMAFATAYLVLTGVTYFVQLTWVSPRLAAGRIAGMEPFLFVPFDSFLYAVDILGYSLMSAATLLAAPVFMGPGAARAARRFLMANGLLLPFVALQMYWQGLIWIAALWAITFPGATWSVALVFRRAAATAGPRREPAAP